MQIKTKAIVLRAQDYNENDKLLTLLTKERGLVFAYVFGARKMKSRLSAVCSMLCYGEFVLFENKGKYSVDNAESERLFFGIRQDLEELAYASYFCELCAGIVPAEEPAEESEPAEKETGCGCCCGTTEDAPAEETCCCAKPEEAPAEEHCCCEKPEQTPAEPEDTAIEIHIAGQKDGSAE